MKPPREMSYSELELESVRLRSLVEQVEGQVLEIRAQQAAVRVELNKRAQNRSGEPKLSDHALLRYMERIYKVDLDDLRQRILTDNIKSAIKMGATTVTIDGVRFRVAGSVITTVFEKPEQKRLPRHRTIEPSVAEGLAEYHEERSA